MGDERVAKDIDVPTNEQWATSYDLIHLTRAYNRKEISFEEWMRLTREWAEKMIQQNTKQEK